MLSLIGHNDFVGCGHAHCMCYVARSHVFDALPAVRVPTLRNEDWHLGATAYFYGEAFMLTTLRLPSVCCVTVSVCRQHILLPQQQVGASIGSVFACGHGLHYCMMVC